MWATAALLRRLRTSTGAGGGVTHLTTSARVHAPAAPVPAEDCGCSGGDWSWYSGGGAAAPAATVLAPATVKEVPTSADGALVTVHELAAAATTGAASPHISEDTPEAARRRVLMFAGTLILVLVCIYLLGRMSDA